jgi:hypothetical protein
MLAVAVAEQVQLDQTQLHHLLPHQVRVALAELEKHPLYQVLPQSPVAEAAEAVTHMVAHQVQVELVAADPEEVPQQQPL